MYSSPAPMAQPLSPVVSLAPPAVEDGLRFEAAVEADLHAAGARGFLRPARVVQPDVDALDQVTGHVDVVVFEEDDPPAKLRPAGNVLDLGDQLLAAVVAWDEPCRRR